ncbi:MAG: Putative signal peptide peptidase SppA [Wolbachia endosymbiont of Ctenocephalides felis wCfeF]|nr:MAG: Putative signal peptide peptidase SppA [Wolbachia endosymbiont of Ctenocephalides felis wCfeF]
MTWLNKPMMIEARSFELLSSYSGKHANFECLKHSTLNPKGVAVIPIYGILTKKPGTFDYILGMTSYEKIHEEIKEALSDKKIETILLDIDCPGGEVNGLFDLSDFIYNARGKKKIIAIANDDAYSAAYAIASSAEEVFVTRTSGVGSIGVIASHIDQSEFDEKQGIKYTTVFAGNRKNDLNPHEPITSESLESLKDEVNRLYEMFLQLIARNRNLTTAKVRSTEAGLYFGKNAVEAGLADQVIPFHELIRRVIMNTDSEVDYKAEVLELIRLCNLSKMPEKIGEFIEKDVSVEEAREILMSELAKQTQKTEILSTIPQSAPEDLMMQVARSRAQTSI